MHSRILLSLLLLSSAIMFSGCSNNMLSMKMPTFNPQAFTLNRSKYPEAEPPKNRVYPAALPLRMTNRTCTPCSPNSVTATNTQRNLIPAATQPIPVPRSSAAPQVQSVTNRTVTIAPRVIPTPYNPPPMNAPVQNSMNSTQASSRLFNAAKVGNPQQIAALLQQGANPNQSNGNGETALHAAASVGNAGTLQQLIAAGANVNASTIQGWTPLHTAARFGHTGAVQVLLNAGANRNARNSAGQTPGQLARAAKQYATLNQLGG